MKLMCDFQHESTSGNNFPAIYCSFGRVILQLIPGFLIFFLHMSLISKSEYFNLSTGATGMQRSAMLSLKCLSYSRVWVCRYSTRKKL